MSVHAPASLLDIATRVLLLDPAASLGEVAKAAGIGRTTLHKLYPTRHDLLVALAHDALDVVERAYTEVGLDVPAEQALDALHRLVKETVPLGPRLEFLLRERTLDTDADLNVRYLRLDEPLLALVARAQHAGILRADLPDWWIVGSLAGAVYSAWEAIAFGRLAPLDAPDLVFTTFLRGVQP